MPVQTLYLDVVRTVNDLRYAWAGDGTLLLSLDCPEDCGPKAVFTYKELLHELRSLCAWQLQQTVAVSLRDVIVEVLTAYHDFDFTSHCGASLVLVSTPPEEYFEAQAAA